MIEAINLAKNTYAQQAVSAPNEKLVAATSPVSLRNDEHVKLTVLVNVKPGDSHVV